jgi:hypothetical protein
MKPYPATSLALCVALVLQSVQNLQTRRPRSTQTPPICEMGSSLRLGEFHGCRAFLVVGDVIDASAYGITSHQPSIVGLQQLGRRSHVPHSRIEPYFVAVWINNDWHAVVNG